MATTLTGASNVASKLLARKQKATEKQLRGVGGPTISSINGTSDDNEEGSDGKYRRQIHGGDDGKEAPNNRQNNDGTTPSSNGSTSSIRPSMRQSMKPSARQSVVARGSAYLPDYIHIMLLYTCVDYDNFLLQFISHSVLFYYDL